MKAICSIGVLLIFSTLGLFGQSRTFLVKTGDDIAKAYSTNGFYRFEQFQKAVLFRKKGSASPQSLLNFNIFSGKLQFINSGGDTLDLINPSLFDSIVIDNVVFYYEEEFFELVASAHPLRLVKKIRIKMRPETIGAYGGSGATSSIERISSYTFGANMYSFSINENMSVKETIDFSWMDENGKLRKANKDNLLLLLPADKQAKAKQYLKETKTSFEKEADLKKLLAAL